jgi:hypothetical protein
MKESISELVSRLRLLEQDHAPDGWPAIKMRDVSALLDVIEHGGVMMEIAWGIECKDGTLLRDFNGPVLTDSRRKIREAVKITKSHYPDLPMRVVKVRIEVIK